MLFAFEQDNAAFFDSVKNLAQQMGKARDLDGGNAQLVSQRLKDLIQLLGQTPYAQIHVGQTSLSSPGPTLFEAMEILGAENPSLLLGVEYSLRVFGRILSAWGNDKQKQTLLSPLLSGKILGTLALSEDALNVENDPLATRAQADGDKVVINGHKQFAVNALCADCIAVAGHLDGKGALFLVPKDAPGLKISQPMDALGYDQALISDVELAQCAVSKDMVVYPPDMKTMLETLRFWENQVLTGASLGLMKGAFEHALAHAKTHKTGGKPIIAFQEVGFRLSDMLTLHQTAKLLAFRAGWMADTANEGVQKGGELDKEAVSLTLCAKVFATEAAEKVASDSLKVLGSKGYARPNPAETSYRCAKFAQIAGTSSEISRMKIGDTVLSSRNQ